MTRVKRSVHARKKRRATLELTKGFRGEAHSNYKRAKEALMKADAYAYRDRRNRKRDFRRLWITRINAAARSNGMSYSQFMHGLSLAGVERERSQSFLVEGEDLIAAAEAAGARMLAGYRLAGSGIGGEDFIDVEAAPLRSAGVLSSGARVIGVYEQRWSAPSGPLCVYLHGVSDPGNVGAVLRSAEAFAASCVALGAGCADPYSPKAVRASMGAIFSVPVARVRDLDELPGERVALS